MALVRWKLLRRDGRSSQGYGLRRGAPVGVRAGAGGAGRGDLGHPRHPAHPHWPAPYRPFGMWPGPVDGERASRGRSAMTEPGPLDSLSEEELLTRARKAMSRAISLPFGSLGRAVQWGVYDTLSEELERRAIQW